MKLDIAKIITAQIPKHTPRHLLVLDASMLRASGAELSTRELGARWHTSHVTAGKILKESEAVSLSVAPAPEA